MFHKASRVAVCTAALLAGVAFSSAAQADYWSSRAKMNDAMDLAGGVAGTIAGAAAASKEAQESKCWTENRRVKSGGKTVVKNVRVCDE